jgi:hypothetical protein
MVLISEIIPEMHSKEVYELAADIRGCELDKYGLLFDNEDFDIEMNGGM